jgi:hypothetical protein
VPAELRIIHILALIAIPALDNRLHLLNQPATSARNSLASILELLLRLAHKARLNPRSRNKLRSRCGDVVGSDDQLLRAVAAGDDAVGRLDQHVGGNGDGFGGGNEAFGPAVVFLLELRRAHAAAAALLHDFGLRGGGGFDQARDGVCDGDGGFEDRIVNLELV